VQRLLDAGMRVKLLSRRRGIASVFNSPAVDICAGDVLDPVSLRPWAQGAATVFHLAGEVHEAGRFWPVNVQGTMNVLAASRHAGASRVVCLSSVGVIGKGNTGPDVDEHTATRPRNEYERSKLAGENECLRQNQAAFTVTALRPPIVYGEGKTSGRDSFLSLLRLLRSGRLVLLGRRYVSSYAYVGDVAEACLTLARHPSAGGRPFIVSEPLPLCTFLHEAATILGVREPLVLPEWAGRPIAHGLRLTGRYGSLYNETRYRPDALLGLGFQPPFGYREGLRRTLAWYTQERLL